MTWPTAKIASLCDLMTGGTPSTKNAEYYDGGDIPWIASGDIHRINITDTDKKITKLGMDNSPAKFLPMGSVLIALNGQGKTRGTVAILEIDNATCNQSVISICSRDSNVLDNYYLFQVLRSMYKSIREITGDKDRTGLNMKHIGGIEIPLPPIAEQHRISSVLKNADELRLKRAESVRKIERLGQAIFHEMFDDPATNPKGFHALPLGEIVEFVGGSQPAKSHFLYEDGPSRVRFVQIRDFRTDKYKTYVPKILAKRPFDENDVMIGRYGPPVFQIFRGLSGTYNVALMKAKPRLHMTSDFVFYLLQEPKLHAYVVANSERTAGQSGVNLDLLEKYPAYAPPKELLQEFSSKISVLSKQLKRYQEASQNMEALFLSLQSQALRGSL